MARNFRSLTIIEDQAAWERGRAARIKENRRIGAKARWVELFGEDVVTRCSDFLNEEGAFAPTQFQRIASREQDEGGGYMTCFRAHPLVALSRGDFFSKMYDSLNEWGGLTEGQTKAVLGMIEKAEKRLAEREAAKQAKRDSAKHVGTIGERRVFELTVKFLTGFETQFGYTNVQIMEDDDANVYVYKGSSPLLVFDGDFNNIANKGDKVKFKATIKAHDFRDGVAQTILSRPSQK